MSEIEVKILVGISGSGKSTMALAMRSHYPGKPWAICSADHFMVNEKGEYEFIHAKLHLAHQACIRKYLDLLQRAEPRIVVDNTNCSLWELAPYVAIGHGFNATVEIIIIHQAVAVAYYRNVHGTPAGTIIHQYGKLQKLLNELPSHWNVTHKLVD